MSGSSPRVRGTLYSGGSDRDVPRFIPARAGNTRCSPPKRLPFPVHPRACGEHDLRDDQDRVIDGSSPRVRGTRGPGPTPRFGQRFIPARAGNTGEPQPPLCMDTVHPRACGEHSDLCHRVTKRAGSSPRVRGTRSGPSLPPGRCPVHPRACGEHEPNGRDAHLVPGSSPRVRGTRHLSFLFSVELRFIPARAGNTQRRADRESPRPVHPRACGEHPSR